MLGCGLYAWDVGTDAGFTLDMNSKFLVSFFARVQERNLTKLFNCFSAICAIKELKFLGGG